MLSVAIRRMVFDRDEGICARCGVDCEKIKRVYWAILDSTAQWFYGDLVGVTEGRSVWEADHIKERASGGDDSLVNLQTLCRKCHTKKSAAFLTKGDAKRVPLNCLVKPLTRRLILEIAASLGISQGEVVDLACAAYGMEERAQGRVQSYSPTIEEAIKTNVTPRPYKGPLLKPSERK